MDTTGSQFKVISNNNNTGVDENVLYVIWEEKLNTAVKRFSCTCVTFMCNSDSLSICVTTTCFTDTIIPGYDIVKINSTFVSPACVNSTLKPLTRPLYLKCLIQTDISLSVFFFIYLNGF